MYKNHKNTIFKKTNHLLNFLSNAFVLLFVSLSLCLMFFYFNYTSTFVVGESMKPTLNDNIVHVGNGLYSNEDIVYIRHTRLVTYNDLVVIEQSDNETGNLDGKLNKYIVKRVIALPNDIVMFEKDTVLDTINIYLNNEKLVENYTLDYKLGTSSGIKSTFNKLISTLLGLQPDIFEKISYDENNQDVLSITIKIPENEIFVLGDNRGNSEDSSSTGTKPFSKIMGVVEHVVKPGQNEHLAFLKVFWNFIRSI